MSRNSLSSYGGKGNPQSSGQPSLNSQLRRYERLKRTFLFLAFMALSLNLRAPITSLPPLIKELQDTLGMDSGMAGFLTSIPVLCFGFLAPLLGWLMKRMSLEASVFIYLAGIILGCLVRSIGDIYAALGGTIIIGTSLTIGNVAGLMVLSRDFKAHASVMTGVYVSGMSIGATLTTAATAPLAQQVGWQISLAAIPCGFAAGAIVLWGVVRFLQARETQIISELDTASDSARPATAPKVELAELPKRSVIKEPIVWLLSIAFAAHTFLFFGLMAWLPSYLQETIQLSVARAGVAASLFQILGLVGCLGIPALSATRRFSHMTLFLVVTVSWFTAVMGFMIWPRWWLVWTVFGGIGSGGGFTVVFGQVMRCAKTLDENRIYSTVVQSAGYVVASISPFVIGRIYHETGMWNSSFMMLVSAALVMTVAGIFASRRSRQTSGDES